MALRLEKIESLQKRTDITQELAHLFSLVDADAKFLAYFSLGMVAPPYENKNFNLSTKSLVRVLAQLQGKEIKETAQEAKEEGDIGLYAESVMLLIRNGKPCESSMTLAQLSSAFDNLLSLTGKGSQEAKEAALIDLFCSNCHVSVRYIARCLVGKLRLGFSDMTLLDAWSWMMRGDKTLRPLLEHRYNVSADIGDVIQTVKAGGADALHAAEITPGIPVRPAAAERLSDAQAIVDKLGPCVAQPKLDGFRVQVHVWTDHEGARQVRFFSRNLHDMSDMFPDIAALVKDLPASGVVMEGEAIAHDLVTGQFLPFQETVKRKRKHGVESAADQTPLTLYLFDVLHLDGKDFFNTSHEERRAHMHALCKDVPDDHRLEVIEERVITTGEALAVYFDEAMAHGLEGLVVKKPDAGYRPGKRNFSWIKLKRQETGSLDDTVDCVILGYYKGAGRRARLGIGALLVGIYNTEKDVFQTIAKIGTGFSDDEWRGQKQMCDAFAVHEQPHNVDCPKALVPDVWVVPEYVCMIRADNITRSPLHTAGKSDAVSGFALRFPRVMGMRPDKDAQQTTSQAEIAALYEMQV